MSGEKIQMYDWTAENIKKNADQLANFSHDCKTAHWSEHHGIYSKNTVCSHSSF